MGKRVNTAVWVKKQNRWKINVQKDGVRKSFYSSIPGRNGMREANKKADAWLDENILNTGVKVDELLDDYLIDVGSRTSESNLIKEKYHVNNFIRPVLKNKKIDNLTEQDLQNVLNKAYKTKDSDGNEVFRSKKTLANIRSTLIAFVKFCRKRKLTTLFPEDLTIPKGAPVKEKRILQPEDVKKVFSTDTTILNNKRQFDDYIYAYRFMIVAGLRPGELRALKQSNLNGRYLTVDGAINVYNQKTDGKNKNSHRRIYLSDLAYKVIQQQLKLKPDAEYIFDINSTITLRERWQRFCKANNIPGTSLYELRHTFVSIVKNLPEGSVKEIVGHSKNMDTFGVYGHHFDGDNIKTANMIDDIFDNILN